jgi:3-methyl-2-oxobutanoate hydroxymethyltransferase
MINIYDLLGFVDRTPKFAKRYADIKKEAVTATRRYVEEVISCQYPGPEHSYSMKKGEAEKLRELLDE